MPNARKRFFHTSKSRLSPLSFGSFTESISGALNALSRAPENQEKSHQEKHQVPVKRRVTQLRQGDDKGWPKTQLYSRSLYSRGNQKRVSEGRSSDVVHECQYTCGKMPFQNFSRITIGFHERRKWQVTSPGSGTKFQKAPSYNKGKQADLRVTRVGVYLFKVPSDTNKSLPAGYQSKTTNTSKSQPLCELAAPHVSCDTTKVYHSSRSKL
jgi:hypothetical protein